MRVFVLLVAAFVLMAPSCPRDYGPSDYAPDASSSYGRYEPGADLLYVAGASAKGDSLYVIAMPGGDVIARIDGPDRRGWAFAGSDVAYYPIMRAASGTSTVHRLDLREGTRERLITDERQTAPLHDMNGPTFSQLILSQDGRELVVARALADGPRVWLGRYDVESMAPRGEASWPLTTTPAAIRLAPVGDRYVLVTFEMGSTGPTRQRMRILDRDLREVATLAEADGLADGEACAAELAPLAGGGWATVCSWAGPYATVVFLDASYRSVSRTTLTFRTLQPPRFTEPTDGLPTRDRGRTEQPTASPDRRAGRQIGPGDGPPERILSWSARDDAVGLLTDRATFIRVTRDGPVEQSSLGNGRTYVNVVRPTAPGVVLAHWNLWTGSAPDPELVRIDLAAGRILARSKFVGTPTDFTAGERLYALVFGPPTPGPVVQRLDPELLTPVGTPVPVPLRDDIHVRGFTAVVRGR